MNAYPYYIVDVFTTKAFGGNPLAVFPKAEGLSAQTMQALAREINFSETTFVFAPQNPKHTAKLRIFTPYQEIPFAGHPTLGSAWVIDRHQQLKTATLILEEEIGPISVVKRAQSWELESVQTPKFINLDVSLEVLADLLDLEVEQIGFADFIPCIVDCGLTYTMVPVKSLPALEKARYSWPLSHPLLTGVTALKEIYLFTAETVSSSADFHVRMFAPGVGVPEDPATGSAAVCLAALLRKKTITSSQTWELEQGLEMGRTSQIKLRTTDSKIYVKGEVQLQAVGEWYI